MGGIPLATMIEDEDVSGILTCSTPTGHDRGSKTGQGDEKGIHWEGTQKTWR